MPETLSEPDLPRPTALVLGGRTFDAGHPAVMAIINRTPDSFFSGNRHAGLGSAKEALAAAVDLGADIVDVGGVRAGAEGEVVSAEQEIARVLPFLEHARGSYPGLILSLDTWRSEVALAAAPLGLDLVNDTWAGHDRDLLHVAVRIGAAIVVSHTGGLAPRTDPAGVSYGPDPLGVVHAVVSALRDGADTAYRAGMPRERILLDPTLDFGKTTQHSLQLLRHTGEIVSLGYPVMQALSRKDFIGESLDLTPGERLEGSLGATAIAGWLGATVFRTHDVRATRRLVDMVATIRGDRPPVLSVRGAPSRGPAETPVAPGPDAC